MFINILQLTFSIYMLQVYDKVLTSYTPLRLAGGGSMPETHHTRQTTIGIYSF